jgi:hypothetical protein
MAVSFVDKTSAVGSSFTIPAGTVAGDIILIFGYRETTTAPSTPTGFSSVFVQSANSNSMRLVKKTAVGGDAGGTFTNASLVIVAVYRGVSTVNIGLAGSTTNASASNTTIAGLGSMTVSDGTSWVVSFGGSLQQTSMSTPATTTLRATQNGTSGMAICIDSNGGVSSYGQKLSANGANAVGAGGSFELCAEASSGSDPTPLRAMMGMGS